MGALHGLKGNTLGIIALFLVLVPFTAWFLILFKQYEHISAKTYRINVLLARTSLFLPAYAVILWVSCVEPELYEAMQIPFSIVEAYSFYSFFAVLVSNMGGPNAALSTMQAKNQPPWCSCCPTVPSKFYDTILNSLWRMTWIRIPLIIVATIGSYVNVSALYLVCTLASLYLVAHTVISLISFYENTYYLNLGHIQKLLTVKLSVGIIIVEGVIETILYMAGVFNGITPTPGYTTEGTVVRWFAFICLLEYLVLSLIMWKVWGEPVSYTAFPSDPSSFGDHHGEPRHSAQAGLSVSPVTGEAKPSFGKYMSDVFSLFDIWGRYSLKPSDHGLTTPLVDGVSSDNSIGKL